MREEEIPKTIGLKTKGFEPLLKLWRQQNRKVSFSELLRRGIKKELKPIAGKRYAHILEAA